MNENENKNNQNIADKDSGASSDSSRDLAQARIDEMLRDIKKTAAARPQTPVQRTAPPEKTAQRLPVREPPPVREQSAVGHSRSVSPAPSSFAQEDAPVEASQNRAPASEKSGASTYLDTYAQIDAAEIAAKDPVAEKQKKVKTLLWSAVGVLSLVIVCAVIYLLWDNKDSLLSPDGDGTAVTAFHPGNVFSDAVSPNISSDTEFPEGIQERFKAAYAAEKSFVGWLKVPGTSIDMPIYQSKDNKQYLKNDLWGKFSDYGVVFMDKSNNAKDMSKNTVLYGHNYDTKDDGRFTDLQFGEIEQYRDLEFYKQNPVIEFNTLYKNYKWKVIGCFVTNGDDTGDTDGGKNYLFAYNWTNMSDNSFMKLADEIEQRSFIHTGVDVQPTDKILTLSTCTYFFDRGGRLQNARCALVARMVREGESETVDVSKAVKNENIRFPQLYYTIFGGTNPYRDAAKWYPEG
ncbi:MAG: sortase [Oscillospiraceae bacterium]|nr:sortase [Oscillospiraceae bacterium]